MQANFRKLIGVAWVCAFLSAEGAIAADMRVTKAPPKAPEPVTNWSGFYGGLVLGFGSADNDAHPPGGGPPFTSWDADGPLFGGVLGYNWQYGRFVYGIEGMLAWADIEGSTNNLAGTGPGSSKIESIYSVAGRFGWLAAHDWLIYGKLGAAWARGELSGAGLAPTTVRNATHSGWTIGAGVEKMIGRRYSLAFGINYYDFNSKVYNPEMTPKVIEAHLMLRAFLGDLNLFGYR
jgi:outer membrane immunogenic protein